MKLTDFLIEILEKNPLLNGLVGAKLHEGKLEFSLPGFSKSGEIWLKEVDGTILAEARYQQITEIANYDDIVFLAWDWFIKYLDRDVFSIPSGFWTRDFKRLGLIEEVQKTEYRIKKMKKKYRTYVHTPCGVFFPK